MEIVCVTVDCGDPLRVATFWNDALRWGGVTAAPDGAGAICGPSDGGAYLEFVRVPEGKTTKNRVHLGCTAGSLDAVDDELARLIDLERYLQEQDRGLWRQLDDTAFDSIIDWGQEKVDVYEHLQRMVNHETLHHGQLIVYRKALDRAFPASWAAYGL